MVNPIKNTTFSDQYVTARTVKCIYIYILFLEILSKKINFEKPLTSFSEKKGMLCREEGNN